MKMTGRLITTAIALCLFSALAAAEPFGAIAGARITEPCAPSGSGGGFSCGPGITNPDKDEAFSSGVTSIAVSAQHPMAGSNSSAAGRLDPGNLYCRCSRLMPHQSQATARSRKSKCSTCTRTRAPTTSCSN